MRVADSFLSVIIKYNVQYIGLMILFALENITGIYVSRPCNFIKFYADSGPEPKAYINYIN
jgi:hypothetical protein